MTAPAKAAPMPEDVTQFEREERYIVFKKSHLTGEQIAKLERLTTEGRMSASSHDHPLPTVECVVVEADWPEYEPVWRMIEQRMGDRGWPDCLDPNVSHNRRIGGASPSHHVMDRYEVVEHVAQALYEKDEAHRGRPWVAASEGMKIAARNHARVSLDVLEALGYARGPDNVSALIARTFATGEAVGRTAERYSAQPYDELQWMHDNPKMTGYWGWDLGKIANDLIDRAYPGLRTGETIAIARPDAGDEDVERVARALQDEETHEGLLVRGHNKEGWEALARAALAAMREGDVEREWPLKAKVWKRTSVEPHEWVLEIVGTIGDTSMSCRHTQSLNVAIEDVPGLPELHDLAAMREGVDRGMVEREVDDPDHQYAVVSSNYSRPFLAGAYPTLDAALLAQNGKPDRWHIYHRIAALSPEQPR